MLPSFASHIIASLTLAIPGMILAETSLSFLGVGAAPAHRQLGRAAAGSAKHSLRFHGALAAAAGGRRHHRCAGTQFSGGWYARRSRPLWSVG